MRYIHVQMLLSLHDVTFKKWGDVLDGINHFMFSYSNFDYQFLTTPQQIADIFPTGNPPDVWGICFFSPDRNVSVGGHPVPRISASWTSGEISLEIRGFFDFWYSGVSKNGDPLWKNFHLGVSNPEVKWQLFWAPSFQTNWQRGEPLGQLEKWRNIVSRELLPGSEVK